MSSSPFAQPSAGGDQFTPAEHNGKLMLVYPKSHDANFETKHGTSDAVTCDIVIVDDKALLSDAMVFGNLARSVKNAVGGVVLGRLGQGANTKGNPPWQLNKFTDADGDSARSLHDAYERGELKRDGGGSFQPPASDPWAPVSSIPTAAGSGWGAAPVAAPAASQPPGGQASHVVDPNLVAFLASKGVTVTPGMSQVTCESIAKTFQ